MPQTAWNLYFRFCRKAASHPHLQIDWNELGMLDKEQYKHHVVAILNTESTLQSELKYGGCDSFGGMSKDLGQRWKDADDLTKSVFNELASEESKRYKKKVYQSYKAFTEKLPEPNLLALKKLASRQIILTCTDDVEVTAKKPETEETVTCNSKQPRIYHIGEVDMTDQEIMEVILRVWGIENIDHTMKFGSTSQEELAHFLSDIEWD